MAYNMYKFQIDSIKIEISTIFFTPQKFFGRYFGNRRVVLLFVWTIKPMLLPLKQHSFIKMYKIKINYKKNIWYMFEKFS